MAYKNILVPHDGSETSDRALEAAISIAKAAGSRVMILNVVEQVLIPRAMTDFGFSKTTGKKITPASLKRELYHHMREEAAAMLDQKKKKYGKDVAIESAILVGYPPEAIIKFAKRQAADLVVMGTRGQRGFLSVALLGSVAREVAEKSPCPVMLVH